MIKLSRLILEIKIIKKSNKYPLDKKFKLSAKIVFGSQTTMVGWGLNGDDDKDREAINLLKDIIVNEYKLCDENTFKKFISYLDQSGDLDDITNNYEENLLNFYDRYQDISVKEILEDFEKFRNA